MVCSFLTVTDFGVNIKKVTKNRKEFLMKSHILRFIREVGGITTTSEMASELKVSWNTAEKKLLELALDAEIFRIKKTGLNLWILKELKLSKL